MKPSMRLILSIAGLASAIILLTLACLGQRTGPEPVQGEARAEMMAGMELFTALDGAQNYCQRTGRLPADARELREAVLKLHKPKGQILEWLNANSTELVDPWDTPLSIRESSGNVIITSAGPDKKFGTSDDIIDTRSLSQ